MKGGPGLKTYIMFGVKTFSNQLSYRSEVWLRLLGNFVAILILTEIWRAVLGNGEIEGIGVEQMITYSIINTLLAALLLTGISAKVDNSLKTGSIASELIKPLSYPLHLLSEGLGNSFYQLVFTSIPSLFIAWFFFGFLPPASAIHFLFFLIALILALAISFLLGYLISLLAFWLMNHFALNWMLGGFITIFFRFLFTLMVFSGFVGDHNQNASFPVPGISSCCNLFGSGHDSGDRNFYYYRSSMDCGADSSCVLVME